MDEQRTEALKKTARALGPIVARHMFLLVNAVIFGVSALLITFGEIEAGLFLGAALVLNMLMGIVQEVRARYALETLQLLTALHVTKLGPDGAREAIPFDAVHSGDTLMLRIGDQVPADGTLRDVNGFEVSEALRTGESDSFARHAGDMVHAGDIVTAGTGVICITAEYGDSETARLTSEAKEYVRQQSPIERSVSTLILYSGWLLLGIIAYLVIYATLTHTSTLELVNEIGSLASVIVPQGLLVITTFLFALGAASYSTRHVLFQEINATEKMGRIVNLCMDKTGTLTDTTLVVEEVRTPDGTLEHARRAAAAYLAASVDESEIMLALKVYLADEVFTGTVVDATQFSSWRRFGAASVSDEDGVRTIVAGPPDSLLPTIARESERAWLERETLEQASRGKRLFALAEADGAVHYTQLGAAPLRILALVVLQSPLRPGIREAIAFFQRRGVRIRIISGDHPGTVRYVARAAGVADADLVVTGAELDTWSDADYEQHSGDFAIFARINPRQKVKLVTALKRSGFTAMVGDGANDALAIKRADLGIAMFAGAPATRRVADVVLMNNSFVALPGAVTLADTSIYGIELLSVLFLAASVSGFGLFFLLAVTGNMFPLLPLNLTFSNYFTLGMPSLLIAYWATQAREELPPASTANYLLRVLPFALASGGIISLGGALVFAASRHISGAATSNMLVLVANMILGFVLFAYAARVYRGSLTRRERFAITLLALFEAGLAGFLFSIPLVARIFTLSPLPPFAARLPTALAVTFGTAVLLAALAGYMYRLIGVRRAAKNGTAPAEPYE